MVLATPWSANAEYTIIGDEAYFKLLINFVTPLVTPGDHSEYTVDPVPINIEGAN
jgi:hypothetical protein